MLNLVLFEGIVTNAWKFGSDLFVRLAGYRDPDQPVKRLDDARDEPDYITARFTNGAQSLGGFPRGALLRVEGLLQSREYHENLGEFLGKARRISSELPDVELTGARLRQVSCERSVVEILVSKHVLISQPQSRRELPAHTLPGPAVPVGP